MASSLTSFELAQNTTEVFRQQCAQRFSPRTGIVENLQGAMRAMPKSACGFLAEAAEFTGAAFTQSLAYLWDLGGRVCLLHHLSKLDAGLVHRLVPDQRYLRWQ